MWEYLLLLVFLAALSYAVFYFSSFTTKEISFEEAKESILPTCAPAKKETKAEEKVKTFVIKTTRRKRSSQSSFSGRSLPDDFPEEDPTETLDLDDAPQTFLKRGGEVYNLADKKLMPLKKKFEKKEVKKVVKELESPKPVQAPPKVEAAKPEAPKPEAVKVETAEIEVAKGDVKIVSEEPKVNQPKTYSEVVIGRIKPELSDDDKYERSFKEARRLLGLDVEEKSAPKRRAQKNTEREAVAAAAKRPVSDPVPKPVSKPASKPVSKPASKPVPNSVTNGVGHADKAAIEKEDSDLRAQATKMFSSGKSHKNRERRSKKLSESSKGMVGVVY